MGSPETSKETAIKTNREKGRGYHPYQSRSGAGGRFGVSFPGSGSLLLNAKPRRCRQAIHTKLQKKKRLQPFYILIKSTLVMLHFPSRSTPNFFFFFFKKKIDPIKTPQSASIAFIKTSIPLSPISSPLPSFNKLATSLSTPRGI